MNAAGWTKRVAALVLAVVLVVGAAGVAAVVAPDDASQDESLALPEFQPDRVNVEPLPAEGNVEPDRDATSGSGTVVIDANHINQFSREDIEPLVRGLTRVGYTVEFYESGDLAPQLEGAKAFVVIDPGTEYNAGDVEDVRRFTGQGGHLLIVGEPTRVREGSGLLGTALVPRRSAVTTLASSYGMTVGTDYLYSQEHDDTNYKFITTTPGQNADVEGVDRTTMYTAAPVWARGGTVLLETSPNTLRSGTDDESGQYPVAVRRNEVVLVGDKTFMRTDRYRVADNEDFVAYLVEFLASSDRQPGTAVGGDGPGDDGTSAVGGTPTSTPTSTPSNGTPPATPPAE